MRRALTVGFEEEFLLVDVDGAPLSRADEVLGWLEADLEADDSARFEPGHLGVGDLVDSFRLTSDGMTVAADGPDFSASLAQSRGLTP
ncbi:hypothetical protein ACQP1G_22260 [Nocardia sp. CA-107356]|uniref:hypothetical protein n=1 Tax=Nocardia sp. CA-107356 TaxID=3239972 RepID=UPI003D89FF15